MGELPFYVSNDGSFTGVRRSECPPLVAKIVHASPLFVEMVRRVRDTGQWERLNDVTLTAGTFTTPKTTGVMYRDDLPPPESFWEKPTDTDP